MHWIVTADPLLIADLCFIFGLLMLTIDHLINLPAPCSDRINHARYLSSLWGHRWIRRCATFIRDVKRWWTQYHQCHHSLCLVPGGKRDSELWQHNDTVGEAPKISFIQNSTPVSVGTEYFEAEPKGMVTALSGDTVSSTGYPTGQVVRIRAISNNQGVMCGTATSSRMRTTRWCMCCREDRCKQDVTAVNW